LDVQRDLERKRRQTDETNCSLAFSMLLLA